LGYMQINWNLLNLLSILEKHKAEVFL
jgi:uncharacterized protein YejL (UPF0352 family)